MSSRDHTQLDSASLIELAAIDAMGLLDEQERRQFEAALAAAPPHVQAHVRREQHRTAAMADLLPEVDPPASLRGRVLSAVRDAMVTVPRSVDLGVRRAGFIGALPVWRAAAIACASAAVVLGAFSFGISQQNQQMASIVESDQARDIFRMSPRMEQVLFAPSRMDIAFVPAASDVGMASTPDAVLMIDPDSRVAVFMARKLPTAGGEYTLTRDGHRFKTLVASSGFVSVSFDDFDPADASRLGLMGPPSDAQPARMLLTASGV